MYYIKIVVTLYIIIINFYGFFMMWYDKKKATVGSERTPEKKIFKVSAFGAAIGVWGGMYFFHHKTMKPAFKFGIPALVLLNILIYIFVFFIL